MRPRKTRCRPGDLLLGRRGLSPRVANRSFRRYLLPPRPGFPGAQWQVSGWPFLHV